MENYLSAFEKSEADIAEINVAFVSVTIKRCLLKPVSSTYIWSENGSREKQSQCSGN
jgi:hypothetical protein